MIFRLDEMLSDTSLVEVSNGDYLYPLFHTPFIIDILVSY